MKLVLHKGLSFPYTVLLLDQYAHIHSVLNFMQFSVGITSRNNSYSTSGAVMYMVSL